MLFRRIAGVSALVAVLVGGLSGVLFLVAGEFRLDSLLDPVRLLGVGSSRAQLLRWGALTDMLGYYLLLVPLVVCVGSELRPRGGPIVDLFTVAGVLYAGIGATAAVVLVLLQVTFACSCRGGCLRLDSQLRRGSNGSGRA
jgi:hypothetical protein